MNKAIRNGVYTANGYSFSWGFMGEDMRIDSAKKLRYNGFKVQRPLQRIYMGFSFPILPFLRGAAWFMRIIAHERLIFIKGGTLDMKKAIQNEIYIANGYSFSWGFVGEGARIDSTKKSRYNGFDLVIPSKRGVLYKSFISSSPN